MVRGTRRVLAVVAVTTALCADRAVMSASQPCAEGTPISSIAQRFVTRLTRGLRSTAPQLLQLDARGRTSGGDSEIALPSAIVARVAVPRLSLPQMPLPPPLA